MESIRFSDLEKQIETSKGNQIISLMLAKKTNGNQISKKGVTD